MRNIQCGLIAVIVGIVMSQASIAQSELPMSFSAMRKSALNCTLEEAMKIPVPFLSELLDNVEQSRQEFTEKEKSHIAAIRGIVEYKKDNLIESDRYFTAAIDINQTDPLILWFRARTRAKLKDNANAKTDCQRSIAINNDFIPASLTLAAVHITESELDKAEILLLKMSELGGGGDPAFLNYLLAFHALKSNRPSNVKDFAILALTCPSTYLAVSQQSIWELRMVAGLVLKDANEAVFAANRVLEFSTDDAGALFAIWKAYRIEGSFLAAQGVAEKMIKLNPDDEKYQAYRMMSMLDVRQTRAAESVAEEMLKRNPEADLPLEVLEKIRVAKKHASELQSFKWK